MLKVAITGNIGSGKSTVSKIFRALGIPVFIADIEARLLYYEDDVKEEIRQNFGENVFNIDVTKSSHCIKSMLKLSELGECKEFEVLPGDRNAEHSLTAASSTAGKRHQPMSSPIAQQPKNAFDVLMNRGKKAFSRL